MPETTQHHSIPDNKWASFKIGILRAQKMPTDEDGNDLYSFEEHLERRAFAWMVREAKSGWKNHLNELDTELDGI